MIHGTLEIGNRLVDLSDITMPVLAIYGEEDHIVPAAAAMPFNDYVGSNDKELIGYPAGHIGMYVSSKSKT